jgi:endonuclease YncB( thermonuclease family)
MLSKTFTASAASAHLGFNLPRENPTAAESASLLVTDGGQSEIPNKDAGCNTITDSDTISVRVQENQKCFWNPIPQVWVLRMASNQKSPIKTRVVTLLRILARFQFPSRKTRSVFGTQYHKFACYGWPPIRNPQ